MSLNFQEYQLFEKVLQPDLKKVRLILNILSEFRNEIKNNNDKSLRNDRKMNIELNNFFKKRNFNNIFFKVTDQKTDIDFWDSIYLNTAEQSKEITRIEFTTNFWKVFLIFKDEQWEKVLKGIEGMLGHEYVHKAQVETILKKGKGHGYVGLYPDVILGSREYFSNEHEMMAWAWDGAKNLIATFGLNKALKVLKAPTDFWDEFTWDAPLAIYREMFSPDEKIYKKYCRYVSEYLEYLQKF